MYFSATRDRDYLTNPDYNGCDMTREIARFLVSLAKYNSSIGRYDINSTYSGNPLPSGPIHTGSNATRDANKWSQVPCILTLVLLSACNVNRTVASTKSCAS